MKKCKVFGMPAAPIGLPSLGVESQVVIAGGVVSSKDKKPSEKRITLVVYYSAVRENTYTNNQVEQVASSLRAAGFRVFIGVLSITGRTNVDFDRVRPNINALDSEFVYCDKSKAQEALQITSRIVNTLGPKPVLVEGSTEGADSALALGNLSSIQVLVRRSSYHQKSRTRAR